MDINQLFESEEFQSRIQDAKDLSAVVEFLKEQGIEITEEQLLAALPKEGELEEVDLENVAGGSLAGWVAYRIGYMLGRRIGNDHSRSGSSGGHSIGGGRHA